MGQNHGTDTSVDPPKIGRLHSWNTHLQYLTDASSDIKRDDDALEFVSAQVISGKAPAISLHLTGGRGTSEAGLPTVPPSVFYWWSTGVTPT